MRLSYDAGFGQPGWLETLVVSDLSGAIVSLEILCVSLNSDGSFPSLFFFFQAEDGIRDLTVTGVQTCALPIFLALLACKAERLSVRRFAEYVSLAQVPDPGAAAEAPWTPPENDLLPLPQPELRAEDDRGDGSPRAPWRWEQLLVEASVIGGKERWARRLAGLEAELCARRDAAEEETRAKLIDRQLENLAYLRD